MKTKKVAWIFHEGEWKKPTKQCPRVTAGGAWFGPRHMAGSGTAFHSWLDELAPKTDWEPKAVGFSAGTVAVWFPCIHAGTMFDMDAPLMGLDGQPVPDGFAEALALGWGGQKTNAAQVLDRTIKALAERVDEATVLRAAHYWKDTGYLQCWAVVGNPEHDPVSEKLETMHASARLENSLALAGLG